MNLQLEHLKFWIGRPQEPKQDVKLKALYRISMTLFTIAVLWVVLSTDCFGWWACSKWCIFWINHRLQFICCQVSQ